MRLISYEVLAVHATFWSWFMFLSDACITSQYEFTRQNKFVSLELWYGSPFNGSKAVQSFKLAVTQFKYARIYCLAPSQKTGLFNQIKIQFYYAIICDRIIEQNEIGIIDFVTIQVFH